MKRYKEMTNSIEEELERIEELAMTDECEAYDNLVELRDRVRDLREEVNCSEPPFSDWDSPLVREYDAVVKRIGKIDERIESLAKEFGEFDPHDMFQMMYPNDDVDDEDFEDGFDLEDFYED